MLAIIGGSGLTKLANLEVSRRLAARTPYPLGLQLVTDQEIGGFDGTRLPVEEGVRAGFVVVSVNSLIATRLPR